MQKFYPHLALLAANLIYGISYSVAKDVMPDFVPPFAFILMRVVGALILFWSITTIAGNEKIAQKDYLKLAVLGFFGVALNQLTFFKGLNITTPINAAIIMTSNPVLVLIVSSIMLKEAITKHKISGVLLGILGASTLIFFKKSDVGVSFNTETIWGDLLILINALSYGVYLVLAKPLMHKYQPITIIKWVFTFGVLFVFPISIKELTTIEWTTFPTKIYWEIGFVVICTTFFAYLLNVYALKKVSPSVVSTYLYLQPVIAAAVAIMMQKDQIDWIKIIATLLIFGSVYLVSKPKTAKRIRRL